MKIKAIYFNEKSEIEPYTIYLDIPHNSFFPKTYVCLCISRGGGYYHSCGMLGNFNGKKMTFESLPINIQKVFNNYLKG